ncbi:hypothetical protein BD779DRAFT_682136 [Infundibulicybe gibba]|nr:hypothetical protein BD779DRAFT_682136 [Infundibulicybe gibba]
MPGLLSLANELIANIADELDTRKIFRNTCRRINAVVSPRVFSYITIDIHEERLDVGISQLEALATKSTCAAEYIRTIDIRRLAPKYNPKGPTFVNGKLVVNNEPKNPKIDLVEERMRELLPGALSTLKGATTAIWAMCGRNPDWASVLVSEFLATLPALDTLHLVAALGQPKLHLDRISNLTKLIVKNDPDAAIAEIIANSPHLTHLDILTNSYEVAGYTTTLHSLLGNVPRGRPLRLEHLGVSGCCVRLDHETLSHLPHLRSLELNSIPYIPVNERQFYTEDLLSKSDRFGSSSKDLWGAVEREGIPLEVVVAAADDAVIDYLASTTGIKKISLPEADTDVLANRFFTQVVLRHSKTLVSLSIAADFEGLWCFGNHNVNILLECAQLSKLSIAVDTSSTSGGKEAIIDGIVNQIMDMAAQMPNLRQLELLSANREILRNARCGNPTMSHYRRTFQALCKSISSFGPVDPAIRINLITVGQWKFQPRCGADGVIKYVL